MRKLLVLIPDDLHKQLKHYAVEHESTVREIVTEAIRKTLEKGGKRKEE